MTETDLLRLCAMGDVPDDAPFKVELPGHPPFAVFHVEGNYYVTDDTCTHGAASLADDGELNGFHIECTWHFGVFDVRTGAVVASPCTVPVKSYPVTVRDGAVFIRIL